MLLYYIYLKKFIPLFLLYICLKPLFNPRPLTHVPLCFLPLSSKRFGGQTEASEATMMMVIWVRILVSVHLVNWLTTSWILRTAAEFGGFGFLRSTSDYLLHFPAFLA